ncbi:MAG TPA: hybrid sensor histidine kinase/response regulator [Polyangiaceae bacterium]|nr:hybrid sensor histidine kinase/response regulator [Polyangiaceae bacterium]
MLIQPLPPVKFLIVDDRDENLLAFSEILRRDGLELVTARSGSEALEQLLIHDFALAIIDVQMPEIDGLELAELMRSSERTQRVPIVLVTAGSRERARLFRGYEAGAVDYLYKPIEPVVLLNKAETFFELFRQKQQLARQIEQLREAHELQARILRFNEMFVAALGHDLRNPISAVITGAKLIARRTTDPDIVRLSKTIQNGATRMQRMTNALFDLTRARLDGGIPITRGPLDLQPLAERVFEEHQLAAPARPMSLAIHGNLQGNWDGTRIEQVISNLLGNAVQHGLENVPVIMDLRGDAQVVHIEVRNGGAIPSSAMSDLFNPFRGRRSGPRSDGLGLGLFIVQQIALAHGGRVDAESSETGGTSFRFRLPREASSASEPVFAAQPERQGGS